MTKKSRENYANFPQEPSNKKEEVLFEVEAKLYVMAEDREAARKILEQRISRANNRMGHIPHWAWLKFKELNQEEIARNAGIDSISS